MNNNQPHWAQDAFFYHIYPLGFCGAPDRNDFTSPPTNRLQKVEEWLPHMQELGVNALYLGPLFESSAHGYDTADLPAGRPPPGQQSGPGAFVGGHTPARHTPDPGRCFQPRRARFLGLSAMYSSTVRLHPTVIGSTACALTSPAPTGTHSLTSPGKVTTIWCASTCTIRTYAPTSSMPCVFWITNFNIDGLRLDVAYLLDLDFLRKLSAFCRSLRPDFWLLGEVVHGDYNTWANPQALDSVTNYEAYKGLYSSLVDKNYFRDCLRAQSSVWLRRFIQRPAALQLR